MDRKPVFQSRKDAQILFCDPFRDRFREGRVDQSQAAAGAAGAGPDMSNMGGNTSAPEDDVVDADFKEV